MSHLRYPEDLFKVQRYQLAKYHVTDARAFQQGSDWWQVPEDPNASGHLMPPYRMFLDAPGSDQEVWSLSTTFTPTKRTNLSAVMTVNSDATSNDYGKIQVLERPDQVTQGPQQVVQDLKNDAAITAALQPYRTGSLLSYGNLLTIPTSTHGLIYLMPVYARQATTAPYPKLVYVLVSYAGKLGYGTTLEEAITQALRNTTPTPSPTPTPPPTPSPSPSPSSTPSPSPKPSGTTQAQARKLLQQAETLFTQAEQAGKDGNFPRRERLLQQAQQKVGEAVDLLQPKSR
jgi:uncharacterized membrane protein (UPF0182 family)